MKIKLKLELPKKTSFQYKLLCTHNLLGQCCLDLTYCLYVLVTKYQIVLCGEEGRGCVERKGGGVSMNKE